MWINYRNIFFFGLIVFTVGLLFVIVLFITEDESISEWPNESESIEPYIAKGERLARTHCASCHLFPEPELLNRRTWMSQTLPFMGPFLGIFEHQGQEYHLDETEGLPDDFYPDEVLISREDWQNILDYYDRTAPERLEPADRKPEIITDDLFFKVKRPSFRWKVPSLASAVRFDPGNQVIYLADAGVKRLLVYNKDLEIIDDFETQSTVSDIIITNDSNKPGVREILITYIGNMYPTNIAEGSVVKGWYNPDTGEGDFNTLIIDNLIRPVETIEADLNQDGLDDLLISEFGHRKGKLFWLMNTGNGYDLEKKILIETPGCLQSQITDYTNNGYPDVIALCSQTDQAIYLFENLGEGEFADGTTLVEFNVLAGSSSFELLDFNGNGHMDILYTSGDNADYSITFKPYHGVYIYLNDGNNNFTKEWFYPVNGAYKAKVRDFNGNGILDIVVISFFADYANIPQEGMIIFKNEGDITFTPYHPYLATFGRWITLDVFDWSGNGVDDIVLANFSQGPTEILPQIEDFFSQSPHLLILENLSFKEAD